MSLATYLDYVDNSGNYVITDENGFLRNPSDWSREYYHYQGTRNRHYADRQALAVD